MRHRATFSAICGAALCGASGLIATPALAHGHGGGGIVMPPFGGAWGGSGYGNWQAPYGANMANPPAPEFDREGWLKECRHRLGDNGVGGAVIGGVVGGVAGNVIAGHGDKVLGTVAGAAVGAIAGAVIDKAEDAHRVQDRCEAMLESGPAYGAGYGGAGYGAPYGYAPYGYMMVPVMMVPVPGQGGQKPACKETVVTEEYVTTLPRRSRHIPPRARAVPDKRIRLAPDKRVPIK